MPPFPIVTICGSMRYYESMLNYANVYTSAGWIVLMPFVTTEADSLKSMLDSMHKYKIELSDTIIVVGKHRGESTTNEINHAKILGKSIIYHPAIEELDKDKMR